MRHAHRFVDTGKREPDFLPVRAVLAAFLLALLAPTLLITQPLRTVLIVSGRDDHGLVARTGISLSRERGSGSTAGVIRAGTMVRVVDTDRDWIKVRSVEGPRRIGWVHDFYLRGVAHVTASQVHCHVHGRSGALFSANQQVEMLEVERSDQGGLVVLVRPLSGGNPGWISRSALDEVPRGCGASNPISDHH